MTSEEFLLSLRLRPLSWSSISSFQYSPPEWYAKYILGEKTPATKEMEFGKRIADSMATDKPLVPFVRYPVVEHKLRVMFGKIPLIGYLDTYDPVTHNFREYKTAKTVWTKAKAEGHGQLKMYALLLFATHKIKPEDYTTHLDCAQTQENGDFSISLVEPVKIYTHEVKLTMRDVIEFGQVINRTVEDMCAMIERYK